MIVNVLEMDLYNMQDVDVVKAEVMMKGHHEEVIIFLKFAF